MQQAQLLKIEFFVKLSFNKKIVFSVQILNINLFFTKKILIKLLNIQIFVFKIKYLYLHEYIVIEIAIVVCLIRIVELLLINFLLYNSYIALFRNNFNLLSNSNNLNYLIIYIIDNNYLDKV